MNEPFDIPKLLKLRKITKAISSYLEQELKSHIATLEPLFHPRLVLGEYISGIKQPVKGSDATFKEFQELYKALQQSKVFYNILDELQSPIEVFGSSLELTPYEYTYKTEATNNIIRIASPLKWVLGYKNQGASQLKELLTGNVNSRKTDIRICVLHLLVMHSVFSKRQDFTKLLEALRFKEFSEPSTEFGNLPLIYIMSPIKTILPPDDLIIQSTELSGRSVFEEVIDLDAINQLTDPYKEHLLQLVNGANPTV
ncbi:MAG: hypothetical protein ACXW1W_01975 [Methylococcaceae bacterium]